MRLFRKIISFLLIMVLIIISFYFIYMRPRYVVPVLMYHSISNEDSTSLHVSPENFEKQITFLHDNEYSVISLKDLIEGIKEGKRFKHNTVVVTFDDGFENNYLNAFPVLARYGTSATIFLITGFVNERAGYLNWDQIKVMMDKNIDFGGHTVNEAYLPSIKETADLWNEVSICREDINRNTGKEALIFCYPTGGFNSKIKNAVRQAGYIGACTTNRGVDRYNKDVFELNRVKITNSDMTKPFHFRAKLSGYYNLFRKLKNSE